MFIGVPLEGWNSYGIRRSMEENVESKISKNGRIRWIFGSGEEVPGQ